LVKSSLGTGIPELIGHRQRGLALPCFGQTGGLLQPHFDPHLPDIRATFLAPKESILEEGDGAFVISDSDRFKANS